MSAALFLWEQSPHVAVQRGPVVGALRVRIPANAEQASRAVVLHQGVAVGASNSAVLAMMNRVAIRPLEVNGEACVLEPFPSASMGAICPAIHSRRVTPVRQTRRTVDSINLVLLGVTPSHSLLLATSASHVRLPRTVGQGVCVILIPIDVPLRAIQTYSLIHVFLCTACPFPCSLTSVSASNSFASLLFP